MRFIFAGIALVYSPPSRGRVACEPQGKTMFWIRALPECADAPFDYLFNSHWIPQSREEEEEEERRPCRGVNIITSIIHREEVSEFSCHWWHFINYPQSRRGEKGRRFHLQFKNRLQRMKQK